MVPNIAVTGDQSMFEGCGGGGGAKGVPVTANTFLISEASVL